MITSGIYKNALIAVCDGNTPVLISHLDLNQMMETIFFEDCCSEEALEKFPKKTGVYICDFEYHFSQGYNSDGYEAYGESEVDYVPVNVKELPVPISENDVKFMTI